jgi:hypothetical protein
MHRHAMSWHLYIRIYSLSGLFIVYNLNRELDSLVSIWNEYSILER